MKTKISIKSILKDFTVTVDVRGLVVARIRLWIASLIIQLGCKIGGFGCKIKNGSTKAEEDKQ